MVDRVRPHVGIATGHARWGRHKLRELQPFIGQQPTQCLDPLGCVVLVQGLTIPGDQFHGSEAEAGDSANGCFVGRLPLERPDTRTKFHRTLPARVSGT
jgi:hypothetical protein